MAQGIRRGPLRINLDKVWILVNVGEDGEDTPVLPYGKFEGYP